MADRSPQNDPAFCSRIRLLHKLIKAVHHLNNIRKGEPPALQEFKNHLATVIKPAVPCDVTLALIEGNAKIWAYSTQLILTDNYEALVVQIEIDMVGQTLMDMGAPI